MIERLFINETGFIIIEIIVASIMALFGIINYGRTRKIYILFFVLAALFLYIEMIFHILNYFQIFSIRTITVNNVPVVYYIIQNSPYLAMLFGFLFLFKEKS